MEEAKQLRQMELLDKLEELSKSINALTLENLHLKHANKEALRALCSLSEFYDQVISKLIHEKAHADSIIKVINHDFLPG
jgi:hypothetical protein